MDTQAITQAISTVGFPIAMCVMMAYYIKTLLQNHKDEMDAVKQAINQLNMTVQRLVDAYRRKEDLYNDDEGN